MPKYPANPTLEVTDPGALMTMLDVHSLAVLGAIFGAALVLWLLWILMDGRRRPTRPIDGTPGAA